MPALAFAIGFVAGLRSMTAPAAVSWAACLSWIDLHGSPLYWMGSRVAVAILSVAAVAELVSDKLPRTPNRTAPGPLITRIVLGGLAGASLAISAQESWLTGAVIGAIGAVLGTFGGYEIRRRLVRALGVKDAVVAVVEDLVAIGLAYLVVTRV
ncbi:MAG TPA: DUF4126 family protein [Gemmatimonadales bacterium]|nr:DUF4126 family protein [Gemmatimonadales bacterium]